MSKLVAMAQQTNISTQYVVSRESGLIRPAEQCPSPNHDERPESCGPQLLVIHGISLPPGQFGGGYIQQFFCNELDTSVHPYFRDIDQLKVSAHLLLQRDGSLIQFVPFNKRAWHAGESRFRKRRQCNDFSIGIELEGDDETPYSDAQYVHLIGIADAIIETYPDVSPRRIAGHCDIAPHRKSDPGPAFDWLRLYDGLAETSS